MGIIVFGGIQMKGIDLDKPITYLHSSMRYFEAGEYHIDRVCGCDVLLLVFEGVLKFSEDGTMYEIGAGEYFIQHYGGIQRGVVPSDSPVYLYIHFMAAWSDEGELLQKRGTFDVFSMSGFASECVGLSRGNSLMIEKTAFLYKILAELAKSVSPVSAAEKIASYISDNIVSGVTLCDLSKKFHFSRNHIIRLMKQKYGMSPIEWLNSERLKYAEHLLEATSMPVTEIAARTGFGDYPYFYRRFVKKNGTSPMEWRTAIRNMNILPSVKTVKDGETCL